MSLGEGWKLTTHCCRLVKGRMSHCTQNSHDEIVTAGSVFSIIGVPKSFFKVHYFYCKDRDLSSSGSLLNAWDILDWAED